MWFISGFFIVVILMFYNKYMWFAVIPKSGNGSMEFHDMNRYNNDHTIHLNQNSNPPNHNYNKVHCCNLGRFHHLIHVQCSIDWTQCKDCLDR